MSSQNLPVFGIDYREANLLLSVLNQLMKETSRNIIFSLSNYLEWQYACEVKDQENANRYWQDYKNFSRFAWFEDNSRNCVREVAGKLPNPWGIYDMYGNIYEACVDVDAEPGVDTIIDPPSVVDVNVLSVLGGCYQSSFEQCQLTHRYGIATENSFVEPLGIRLICKEL